MPNSSQDDVSPYALATLGRSCHPSHKSALVAFSLPPGGVRARRFSVAREGFRTRQAQQSFPRNLHLSEMAL
ncbi:hypothetical protein BV25DRAFT_1824823 [Artomyces pyxidatus]|uniref:Uncharacterized protein n=1 Tax=Artomyces pyxidatus TaxID=48021 RepID=A0ACB8T472_9AGAM|nr:hypothetical protein BV25DRAFT_1824823 [Artomyces pyxidatus]